MDELFDIFRGEFDKDPEWLEAVRNFSDARKRMEKIAAAIPGQYFIYSTQTSMIVAQIDTQSRVSHLSNEG